MTPIVDTLRLDYNDDSTVATLSLAPGAKPKAGDVDTLMSFLLERGLVLDTDSRTAVEMLLTAFGAEPEQTHRMIVANGDPARHGEDGRLVWSDACAALGSIERPGVRPRVDEGALIARAMPPSEGTDGRDVRGGTIPARHGEPMRFGHDESVRAGEGGALYATRAGTVFYDNGMLRVSTRLDIDGDVSAGGGNVEFDGDIAVVGGVADGLCVQATGGLTVNGLIGAARIVAGVDGALEGGVSGRRRASVLVERDVRARYLESALVVVGRHAEIHREITDCEMTVGGWLRCPRGALRGGVCSVGGACELGELGSPGGGATRVVLGSLHDFESLCPRLDAMGEAVDSAEAKTREQYDTLRRCAPTLTESQADLMTELEFSLASYGSMRTRLVAAWDRLKGVTERYTETSLSVERTLHRGVSLSIGGYEVDFPDPIRGPVRITLGAEGRPVITDLTTESETDLSDHADVRQSESSSQAA